ncbi:MAG: cytochrome c maturation protein CcmE [Gammaproteobacteria bacterium]|nr:cytochrome c maturation protein CcmE [Gammaproteobacteria bacterium]
MAVTRKRRFALIVFFVGGIGLIAGLVLFALRQNVDWFYMPTEIRQGKAPMGKSLRVGGLVVKGSVVREPGSLFVRFTLSDRSEQIVVEFKGSLPDLFREGQGIIAIGKLDERGIIVASQVLAKHDENYMPPQIKNGL